MPKCENCYHYEACNYFLEKENKHLGSCEGFVCEHFKDKSLILELPCKEDIKFLIVRHGRWNPMENVLWNGWECSVCGKKMYVNFKCDLDRRYPYCPNCGAKMINSD